MTVTISNGVLVDSKGEEISSPPPKMESKYTSPEEGKQYNVSLDGPVIGMTGQHIHSKNKVDATKTRWGDRRSVEELLSGIEGYGDLKKFVDGEDKITRWFQVVTKLNQCSSTLPVEGVKIIYLGTSNPDGVYYVEEIPGAKKYTKLNDFLSSSGIVYPYDLTYEEASRLFHYGGLEEVPHYSKLNPNLFGNRVVTKEDNTIIVHEPLRQKLFEKLFNLEDSKYLNPCATCFHIFGNSDKLNEAFEFIPEGTPYTRDVFKLSASVEDLKNYVEKFVMSNSFPEPKNPNTFVKRGKVFMTMLIISPDNIVSSILEGFRSVLKFKSRLEKVIDNIGRIPSSADIEELEIPGFVKSQLQRSKKSIFRISKAPTKQCLHKWIENERNKYHIHKFIDIFWDKFNPEEEATPPEEEATPP